MLEYAKMYLEEGMNLLLMLTTASYSFNKLVDWAACARLSRLACPSFRLPSLVFAVAHAVVGLDEPHVGSPTFDGEPIVGLSAERSMVFQNANLLEWFTVEESIVLGLRATRSYEECKYKILRFIQMMGGEGFEKLYPPQMSGDMASRSAQPLHQRGVLRDHSR